MKTPEQMQSADIAEKALCEFERVQPGSPLMARDQILAFARSVVRLTRDTDQHADVRVTTYRGEHDGAKVVQIDTEESTGHIRVNLNDSTVFDGDPEMGNGKW